MAYNKLIQNINSAVEKRFAEISTRYNFDNGDEFEIALCELLRLLLPIKYGICRGFAVTIDDDFAGDDIIIYDKERFPTLRLLEDDKYDKKQEIPIEAVYCYIEAKNTLIVSGEDSNFEKALKQSADFKMLERDHRKILSIDHHTDFGDKFSTEERKKWPNVANPIFTAVITRNLKDPPVNQKIDLPDFLLTETARLTDFTTSPDLIIAGGDVLLIPEILNEDANHHDSPFVNENNQLKFFKTPKTALSVGLVTILYALDNIRLGEMPYSKIINKSITKNA